MKYLILLIASIIAIEVQAKYYYVDPVSGSDANDGTSIEPWLTVQHALGADSPMKGGDILQLKPGTYRETNIKIHVRGSTGKFIKIRGGAGVVFEGNDLRLSSENAWSLVDPIKRIYVYDKPVIQQGKLKDFL